MDSELSLRDREQYFLSIGALFLELVSLAKDCGFPPSVVAAAVVQRIEPVVLYVKCRLLKVTCSQVKCLAVFLG